MPSQTITDNWLRLQQSGQRWLGPVWLRLAAVGAQRWKSILTVLMAVWVLANLARLVWLLVPVPSASQVVTTPPINAALQAGPRIAKNAVNVDAMVAWHLFGEVNAQAHGTPAAVEEQARETTLNLQLLGVISSSDPAQSAAVILVDGKHQQFTVGEQIPGPGKVVLSKVLVDRVIIENNGHYETLWLYDPSATAQLPQPSAETVAPKATVVDQRNNRRLAAVAQNYRQQLYQNPSSLADVIQVAPVNEAGKLTGYRIQPGRDRQQFEQFGFKPGDIITGINGVALDDPQRALELYNVIRTATEASFTVRREGEDITLMVSLQNTGSQQQ